MRRSSSLLSVLLLLSLAGHLVDSAPPQITQPPKDQHQYQGGAVTFTCVADDATEYTWLKNDRVPETKRWKTNGNELQYKDLSVKDDKIQVTCRATNAAGESSEAHAQLSVLALLPPVGVVAQARSSTSVEVMWREQDVGDVTVDSFTVEYSKLGESSSQTAKGLKNNRAEVTNLMPNTKYSFFVYAVNSGGNGEKSREAIATTLEDVPVGPPISVAISEETARRFKVTWEAPKVNERNGVITKYQVNFRTSGVEKLKDTTENETQIVLDASDEIKPYTQYSVAVAAFTKIGMGPYSTIRDATTLQAASDGPPETVVAIPEDAGIRVRWTRPSGNLNGELGGYNITYTSSASRHSLKVDEDTTSVLITEHIFAYTNYTIEVQALTGSNSEFAGPLSKAKSVKTNEQRPSRMPKFLSTEATDRTIIVEWEKPETNIDNGLITSYELLCYPVDGQSKNKSASISGEATDYKFTGLKPYTEYVITLAVKNKAGVGPVAETRIPTMQAAPGRPRNLTIIVKSSTQLRIEWMKPLEINGILRNYIVSYETADGMPTTITVNPNKNFRVFNNLEKFTKYTVSITAFTEAGQSPSVTAEDTTSEDMPSLAPSNLHVKSSGGTWLEMSWSPIREVGRHGIITGYQIQHQLGDGKWAVRRLDLELSSNLTDLEPFSQYNVQISGRTSIGSGPWSDTVIGTTSAKPPKSAPQNVELKMMKRSMEVVWTRLDENDWNGRNREYVITYSHNNQNLRKIVNYTVTNTIIDGLTPYTKYSVYVFARNEAGDGDSSQTEERNTLEDVPGAPRLSLRGVKHYKSLEVEWQPPDEPNGRILSYSLLCTQNLGDKIVHNKMNIGSESRSYNITPLVGNRTYQVSLRASTGAGQGEWASVTGMTFAGPPDVPPPNVNVTKRGSTFLRVEWDEIEIDKQHGIISKYHITVTSKHDSKIHHRHVVGGSQRYFMAMDLKPYTSYTFRVAAVTNGSGPYSDARTEWTLEDSPSEVLNVRVLGRTQSSITLTWNEPLVKNGLIMKYKVEYHVKNNTRKNFSQETSDRTTSLTVTRLKPYTTYDMVVIAYNSIPGAPSDDIEVQTDEGLPSEPTSVSVVVGQYHAGLSWQEPDTKNGRLVGYTVRFKALQETLSNYPRDESTYLGVPQTKQHKFTTLQPNMRYNFTVVAHTSRGSGSESFRIDITQPAAPSTTKPPLIEEDSTLGPFKRRVQLYESDETFGKILYYRLEVWYAPISSTTEGQSQPPVKHYIAGHFAKDRLPLEYVLGDNTTDSNGFINRPLEAGYQYYLVFHSHVSNDVGKSLPTETFEIVLPTSPPKSEDGFPIWIIIIVVVLVLLVTAGLVIFIVILRRRLSNEEVEAKMTPVEDIDYGDVDASDSIEYIRRQNRSTMERYPSVKISDFDMHVKRLQANGNLKFSQEYESIKLDTEFTSTASNLAINDDKNRYSNIVAYDHSRVRLNAVKGQQGSDYINANYIDGHQKKNAYIATQGPLEETAGAFWRMVWEQRSSTIVMLTSLEERGRPKCFKYWPDSGSAVFDVMEVTLKEVIVLADYIVRTFTVAKTEHRDEVREVKQLQFMSWPDHGVPTYATAMLAFLRKVKAASTPEAGPVVVHCSAGVGRTGAFIVIDAMLDRVRETDSIDVYGHVTVLRSQRNYMVQTEDQYFFIHEAMLEAIHCGNTEINAKDLPTAMQKLNEVVADDGSTAVELEFKRLAMDKLDPSRFSTANRQVNKNKNRFVNILPFENTRAALNYVRGVDGSDYINASVVDGYKQRNAFIATQGPLKETEQDFWRMLWEQESKVVVMLTKLTERGQEKCHQYWPEGKPARYGPFVVDPLSEQRKADCILRQFKMTNANEGTSRTICQFQYVGWPENRSPVSGRALIDLIGEVQKLQEKTRDRGPVTVHCSAGVGRTGCFVALSIVLERMRCEGVLDIFQTVKMLRIQRPAMVQTLDQYQFVYDTALEYLDSFDHYADYAPLDVQEDEQEVD